MLWQWLREAKLAQDAGEHTFQQVCWGASLGGLPTHLYSALNLLAASSSAWLCLEWVQRKEGAFPLAQWLGVWGYVSLIPCHRSGSRKAVTCEAPFPLD